MPFISDTKPNCRLSCIFAILTAIIIYASPATAQLTNDDIAAMNIQGQKEGWTFTVSENSATQYPIENLCGAVMPKNWRETTDYIPVTVKNNLPSSFDWRDNGGCPPIRNQGSCGSCWAFSTVGAIECNIKLKDEIDVNLSEQWLVSCNIDGSSCDGGWYQFDHYIHRSDQCGDIGGVMEADYPYAAADLPCNCPYPRKYFLESWSPVSPYWGDINIDEIKQAILDYGPVSVGVYSSSAMHGYNSGIFNYDAGDYINHLVVLVGWDDNQGDSGIWIMRNSWGVGWGEEGYMRIEYGASMIGSDAAYIIYNAAQRVAPGESEFSDVLGDNDGMLEEGETIEMVFSVVNKGGETVTDVSVEMTIDDPALTVLDGSTYLSNIESKDTASNASDPFTFSIPAEYTARIDSFILAVTWNCGIGCDTVAVDTMVVEMGIGSIGVLVVDDDDGDNLEQYYEEAFWYLRTPYVEWSVAEQSEPDGATLNAYDAVIWFVGDHRSDPLNSSEILTMMEYLDGGGNMMLSGQGIAAQLNQTGSPPAGLVPNDMDMVLTPTPTLIHDNLIPPFMQEYLHANYLSTSFVPIVAAEIGAQSYIPGDSLMIYTTAGADNQTAPDHIEPVGGGVAELGYLAAVGKGAVSYSGAYKTMFMSFGFEAVVQGNSRWTDRSDALARVLAFFSYQMPDSGPAANSAAIDRGVITYSYEIYEDAGLTVLVASADNQPEGAGGKSSWTVPVTLSEDEDYYWRVRASDDGVPGEWSDPARFWVNASNQAPSAFDLISPANGSVVGDMWPTFVWESSVDTDGFDSVYYCLVYSPDQYFSTADSITNYGDTSYHPTGPLDLGGASTCYWKVSAYDMCGGDRNCSQVFSFSSVIGGDANGDGMINVGDPVFLIAYIFKGGLPPDPEELGDANCDGQVNVGDPVYLISYIFKGGPPPGCF